MLYSLLLIATSRADGLTRFEEFFKRTNSFSVTVKATSVAAGVGAGSLTVVKPDSLRLTMKWPSSEDYTYVKSPEGATEFERASAVYMEMPPQAGLSMFASSISDFKQESYPMPLLSGKLKNLVPAGTTFALTSKEGGIETFTANFANPEGDKGKVVARIDSTGKLVYFEHMIISLRGSFHRKFEISNYMVPAKTNASTFSLVPPLGFEMHHRATPFLEFAPGDTLKLGTWNSPSGLTQIDSKVKGKLVVVREDDSVHADKLISYLRAQRLPVGMVVASLGSNQADYWSPSPEISRKVSAVGTPLSILIDNNGVVAAMWLGFDPNNPGKMLTEMRAALEGELD